jgi:hypothetical protein
MAYDLAVSPAFGLDHAEHVQALQRCAVGEAVELPERAITPPLAPWSTLSTTCASSPSYYLGWASMKASLTSAASAPWLPLSASS